MNNFQIEKALKKVKSFQGVWTADTLKKVKFKYPLSIVVNTSKSSQPGTHWIAIVINHRRHGVLFNSFGYFPPIFKTFMKKHCVKWTYTKQRLQNPFSLSCGCYCVKFIIDFRQCKTLKCFYNIWIALICHKVI